MSFTITADTVSRILADGNQEVIEMLADQFIDTIDPQALGPFLLTRDVVRTLLVDNLSTDPEGTVKALQKMPVRKATKKNGKRKAPKEKKETKGANGKQTRKRLSDEDVEMLKGKVLRFIGGNEGVTRADLMEAVGFPSQGAYNRIMKELKEGGEIVSEGEKRNTTYELAK